MTTKDRKTIKVVCYLSENFLIFPLIGFDGTEKFLLKDKEKPKITSEILFQVKIKEMRVNYLQKQKLLINFLLKGDK